MNDNNTLINDLKKTVKSFVEEREWRQFHTPKNLSMSVAIESAELMELFQWLSKKDSEKAMSSGKLRKNAIDEVADVFIYLIAFCNENDIDIKQAIDQKMKKNKKKYPVNIFKGRF
tara:strand:+ start:74 stop:421 length:348 start_codon:yes stop_codon:yes gene_type:complete